MSSCLVALVTFPRTSSIVLRMAVASKSRNDVADASNCGQTALLHVHICVCTVSSRALGTRPYWSNSHARGTASMSLACSTWPSCGFGCPSMLRALTLAAAIKPSWSGQTKPSALCPVCLPGQFKRMSNCWLRCKASGFSMRCAEWATTWCEGPR